MDGLSSLYHDLAWQIDAGADECVGERVSLPEWGAASLSPPPQIQPTAPPVASSPRTAAAPAQANPPPYTACPVSFAGKAETTAQNVEELRAEIAAFEGCALKYTAMNLVFSAGNPKAKILCLGDAPSEDDDRSGAPFSGAAGRLLDALLATGGMSREDVYLTNLVFWRPPGGRTPSEIEVEACLPFTERHIALAKPSLLLIMGPLAMKSLLRTKETFAKKRGQWCSYAPPLSGASEGSEEGQTAIPCLPLYHPTYLLRQPAAKRQMWADWLQLIQGNKLENDK